MQADIGFMNESNEYKSFLCVCDVYSRRIWCEALITKSGPEVLLAFEKIFAAVGEFPQMLQVDRGSEFLFTKFRKYLEQHQTLLRFKGGQNKSNFSEFSIYKIKLRMARELRYKLRTDWENILQKCVNDINNTPMKSLNNLRPSDFSSKLDDLRLPKPAMVHYTQQNRNQREYLNNKSLLQKGDYVFTIYEKKAFDKASDYQVSPRLWRVLEVRAYIHPAIFKLYDPWTKEKHSGWVYRDQLKRTIPPESSDIYKIEKTVKTEMRGKTKWVLVKWLGFPKSHNTWLREDELLDAEKKANE